MYCNNALVSGSNTGLHGNFIPDIPTNALILLGLSSGTYAALKLTENKQTPAASIQVKVLDYLNYKELKVLLGNTEKGFCSNGNLKIDSVAAGNYELKIIGTPAQGGNQVEKSQNITVNSSSNPIFEIREM